MLRQFDLFSGHPFYRFYKNPIQHLTANIVNMPKYRITVLSKNRAKGKQVLQVEVGHGENAIPRARQMYGDDYLWDSADVNEVPPPEDAIKRANHARNLLEANLITVAEYITELNKIRNAQGLPPLPEDFASGNLQPNVLH